MISPRPDRKISTRITHDTAHLDWLITEARRYGIEPDPDHVLAAALLIDRGEPDRARACIYCPPFPAKPQPGGLAWVARGVCRLRACPSCSERAAISMSESMIATATSYQQPYALLVTAPSRSLLDLPMAMRGMRTNLVTMRRRAWFARGCRAGVGAIEMPLTRDGHRWALHMHGIVDLRLTGPDLDLWRASASLEWSQLTGQPSALWEVEDLRDPHALLRYAVKTRRDKSWSPQSSDLSPRLRLHLDLAIRGRRLVVRWGERVGR